MKKCFVIRHVSYEGLGTLAPLLLERGYEIYSHHGPEETLNAKVFLASDLAIVLGGPMGVYETHIHPFIAEEIAAVRERLKSGKPILGICLGAQIMAAALGARVASSGGREIGWAKVTLTPAGRQSVLSPLETSPVLHWHGDNCDLPEGCTHLAATDFCRIQAFSCKPWQLALQFHLEVLPERINMWLEKSQDRLRQFGYSPEEVRRQAGSEGPVTLETGRKIFAKWLDEVVEQAK